MKFSHLASVVALPLFAAAQTPTVSEPVSNVTEALGTTVAPTPEDLFDFETIQLLDSDIEPLNDTLKSLFDFDDINVADPASTRRARSVHGRASTGKGCKTFPGDRLWPIELVWKIFDIVLGGSLIKTVPIAAPCYSGANYDAAKCAHITSQWTNSDIHELDPTSMMSPVYQGLTCLPTANASDSCTLGGYPSYAINVTNVAQIQLAINFARALNIRLVVKNTGHDFSGKSGGAGALGVWTHHLKGISYSPNYVEKTLGYTGPAFKFGSGVVAKEAYAAADAKGLVIVGGEGKTVGLYGGWTAGGGHSPLSSILGMGADQVLSMEAVTADGRFVTASPSSNADLFWALRGGGGGTFAVVTSVTVRAYKTFPVTVVTFSFDSSSGLETFWAAVRAYWDYFPTFADAGTYSYFWIFPGDTLSFLMAPFFAPNKTTAETEALLKPWFDRMTALGVPFTPVYNTYPTFLEALNAGFPQEAVANSNAIIASRLFPRSTWSDPAALNATFEAWRGAADSGKLLIGFNIRAPNVVGSDNAVVPAWRDTVLHSITGAGWAADADRATIEAARKDLSATMLKWKAVTPTSGAYLGECDIEEVDWQKNFFGVNYNKLLSIKKKFDPKNVFWVRTGVGSEIASVRSTDPIKGENGPLCYV